MRAPILLALLLIMGFTFAMPTNAALLPDCDQTVYNVQSRANLGKGYLDYKITPDRFEEKYPATARDGLAVEITVNRPCGIDDFIQLFINLANWGLSILAVIATTMFIWGGFTFLTAGGRDEYIKNGKDILIGTSTGVIVVLSAYLLVTFWSFASLGQNYAFAPNSGFSRSIFGQGLSCLSSYTEECNVDQDDLQKNFHLGCGDKKTKLVAQIQSQLSKRKCLEPNRSTGCFDSVTRDAVTRFQNAGSNRDAINNDITNNPKHQTRSFPEGSVDYYTLQAIYSDEKANCD
jgi:hypothetical protein